MKMIIEIEDSIYNTCRDLIAPMSVELLLQRMLTRVVTLVVANPEAAKAIRESGSAVPEYRDILEYLERPAEEEENDKSD